MSDDWREISPPPTGGGRGLRVGESVEGEFTHIGMRPGWKEDEPVMEFTVGDRTLWAGKTFHTALGDSGVQNGDTVRIERLPNAHIGQGMTRGTYQIEVLPSSSDKPPAPAW